MPFIPNSPETLFSMLKEMGYSSFEELYDKAVPRRLQYQGCLGLPEPMTEMEISDLMKVLAAENTSAEDMINFIGCGIYDHYVPSAVEKIQSRSEFYTAYTPYQAEVSQGTLTAIFEFQSMITALTGMDVANASVYDGGSAIAEAVNMAVAQTRKKRVLISSALHPLYQDVIRSYTSGREIILEPIEVGKDGRTSAKAVEEALKAYNDVAAFVLQNPNFFGIVENGDEFDKIMAENKALFIVSADPISLGFLKPPGEYGADIAVGEAQPLGNRMNFGGPTVGYFTAKKKYVRQMPGRIAGITEDVEGNKGIVLTYQTREQHIRREKATSNICTNQQLMALASTIYMALLGDKGLAETADLCFQKAHYLAEELVKIDGIELAYPDTPFFKEFAIKVPEPAEDIVNQLAYRGILAGADLGRFYKEWSNVLLVAVTEKRLKEEMDYYVENLKEILGKTA